MPEPGPGLRSARVACHQVTEGNDAGMRIAYVTETWHPAVDGVVTRLDATLDSLHRMGHHTLVIAPSAPGRADRPAAATAPSGGVADDRVVRLPAVSLPALAGGRPFGMPLPGRVRTALDEFGADIVHVVNPFLMARAGVAAARRLGLPLVASFHQDLAMVTRHMRLGIPGGVVWGYTRRRYAHADITLATSQAMLELLDRHGVGRPGVGPAEGGRIRRRNRGRLALWPCGVDTDRFHPRHRSPRARDRLAGTATGRTIVLYAGRLAPEKGLRRLYPLARRRDLLLVVAGDGPQRCRMERDLAGCAVRFTGWLSGDDLAEAYAGADVFAFPSVTETLGLSLIEALAAGVPVLAADSPPTREILGPRGGTTLPATDWEASAADTARFLGGPGRQTAAEHARERVAGWDWMEATGQLVGLYAQIRRRVQRGGTHSTGR